VGLVAGKEEEKAAYDGGERGAGVCRVEEEELEVFSGLWDGRVV